MERWTWRAWRSLVLSCACVASTASAGTLTAIEYYNAALDHYFITSIAVEITALDAGAFAGWQRTGGHFGVLDPASTVAGASPVCRLYGLPSAGLDTHFYSASPAECNDVLTQFAGAWEEETPDAFGIFLPDVLSGQCPANGVPVYRAWNGRTDSNHRFTTDVATMQAMLAKGYIAEGYGPGLPVAMCAPPEDSTTPGTVPVCVATASNAMPYVGSTIALSATCSNGATSYAWTGCTSATADCTASASVPGAIAYAVVATNAFGQSAATSVPVTWQAVPAPPKCAIVRTSQTDPPLIGDPVVLDAHCDSTVTSYAWTGCASTTSECTAQETTAGAFTYTVVATNGGGASAPATETVHWATSIGTSPGLCGQFPSYLFSDLGVASARLESLAIAPPQPGFAWNGAWTIRFVVPSTMDPARLGRFLTAESGASPPTVRDVTISRNPCDFRAIDASGVNGPYARASGVATNSGFTIDPAKAGYPVLTPGQTYFVNLRNFDPATNAISCPSSPGRCEAYLDASLPR